MPVSAEPKVVRTIRADEYLPWAKTLKHVFLTGDLKNPQPQPFFRDPRVEVMLCYYEKDDGGLPHWHESVTEYELLLEGEIGCFEIASGREHTMRPGDLLVVPEGACVKRVVHAPSRSVALKVPSNPEKVQCEDCPRDCAFRLRPMRPK